jgi:hypothetical protein
LAAAAEINANQVNLKAGALSVRLRFSSLYHGTGHWEVTGGTGRFLGATGQGTIEGDADFNQGRFVIAMVGTVMLANENNQ